MANINLLNATRTVEAAMPFVLYRLAVCLGTALACLFAALFGAGTFIAFASFSAKPGGAAGFGALLGLAGIAYLLWRFRAGLFFNIQAGHLALLAELSKGVKLPQGKAQVELAKDLAAQTFPSPAGFQDIKLTVQAVLQELPARRCPWLGRLANRELAALLGRLAGWLAASASLAIVGLGFTDMNSKPWARVRAGLILHVRHFDALSRSHYYLLAFEYAGLALAYVAMLYPVDSAVSLLPVDIGIWRHVFALLFAFSLKAAFLEPIATAALAEAYFKLAEEDTGAGEDEAKVLEEYSEAFRKISEKAANQA